MTHVIQRKDQAHQVSQSQFVATCSLFHGSVTFGVYSVSPLISFYCSPLHLSQFPLVPLLMAENHIALTGSMIPEPMESPLVSRLIGRFPPAPKTRGL